MMKLVLILIVVAAGLYMAAKKGYITLPWDNQPKVSPIYDTDEKNDRYIKKDLSLAQLRLLDRALNEEQLRGGHRLSGNRLRELVGGDKAVIAAYNRWRKCVDLMRSSNHVIYPRERGR
jgi:hypothetical protein